MSASSGVSRYVHRYLADSREALADGYLEEGMDRIVPILRAARTAGRTIYFFGNGGSGSTASHMANDIAKSTIVGEAKRFKCLSLSDPIPTILAWANDSSYADIYSEQIKNLGEPGDVAVGISGSGNSPNVLRGLEEAKRRGLVTIGLIGTGGGKMKTLCDVSLIVPSSNMQHIEDVHLVVCHLITSYFRDEEPRPTA